jgi:cephalosporin-C deacetylase
VALMDPICPPSTVYAAYNSYQGPRELKVYEFNEHEGGEALHALERVRFVNQTGLTSKTTS